MVKINYLISTIHNTVNQGVIKLAKQDPPIAAVIKLNIKLLNSSTSFTIYEYFCFSRTKKIYKHLILFLFSLLIELLLDNLKTQ